MGIYKKNGKMERSLSANISKQKSMAMANIPGLKGIYTRVIGKMERLLEKET